MKRFTQLSQTIIYLTSLILLLFDVYGSDTTLSKYLHIDSRFVAAFSIVLLIGSRILYNKSLDSFTSKFNSHLVFPISTLVGVSLAIYDYVTPANYVFSLFRLQYTQIFLISVFSGIMVLLQQSNSWFEKYYPQIIFASAFIIFTSAVIVSLFPFDIFIRLSHEDSLFENLQVIVLLGGALWSTMVSQIFNKQKEKIHSLLFRLASFALIFVVGDEISWGQRLFHIPTPQFFASHNSQQEITIHNLPLFDVNLGYILIGFYGAFAWIFQYIITNLRKRPFSYYIPLWFCSAYYFLGFIFNFYIRMKVDNHVGNWSEFMELMLHSGVMFTMLALYIKLTRKLHGQESVASSPVILIKKL